MILKKWKPRVILAARFHESHELHRLGPNGFSSNIKYF